MTKIIYLIIVESIFKTIIHVLELLEKNSECFTSKPKCAALAQMVACLPLVQWVWGLIPGEVVNFHLKIFNLGATREGWRCTLSNH